MDFSTGVLAIDFSFGAEYEAKLLS